MLSSKDPSYIMTGLVHLSPSIEGISDVSHRSQRLDTAVSDSASESHLMSKQHKEIPDLLSQWPLRRNA